MLLLNLEMPNAATFPLNGFLLRQGVDPFHSLSPTSRDQARHHLWRNDHLAAIPSNYVDAPDDVILTIFSRPSSPSPWEVLIEGVFSPEGFAPSYSQVLGALVFMKEQDPEGGNLRWICWAFGSGSRSLARGSLEPRFGLLAALNRVALADDGGLRQLEYRSFGAYRQRTGHRAGRDTPLTAFRIDPLIDLLSGIGGRTGTGASAQVYGGRALRVRAGIGGVQDLQDQARSAMADFRGDAYKREGFSFVDDFLPVEHASTLEVLRGELATLLSHDSDRVDAFFPDDLVEYEDPRAIHYVLLPKENSKHPSRVTLTTNNLVTAIGDAGERGLSRTLRFLDASGEQVATATVLDCVAADFELGEERFVVCDGDFYRVSEAFLDRIDSALDGFSAPPIALPHYAGGNEGLWLEQVAADHSDEFVRTDGCLIRLEGESAFEPADLIHTSGVLVHAKRKGRSSALSYAMTQARRSCQMLPSVAEARRQLDDIIAERALTRDVANAAIDSMRKLEQTPPHLPVVLAILGQRPARGLLGLPLLAKLELAETARQVGQLGFALSVAQVGV